MILKIIPELQAEVGFEQNNPWHIYDVWNHTLVALERTNSDLDLRLAMLLHDIGKPHSYQDEGDIRHFRGHAQKSTEISKQILERLGYPKERIGKVLYLIHNHSNMIDVDKVNRDNIDLVKKLIKLQYCDAYAYNPQYGIPTINKISEIKDKITLKSQEIKRRQTFWEEDFDR